MAERFELDEAALGAAGRARVSAAKALGHETAPAPTQFLQSITGIGYHVQEYLRGVFVARAALADAVKSGCEGVARVMRESATLDRAIAGELHRGFAAPLGELP